VATPEKALLDLIYLQPGGERAEYLEELRLQNLERLDTAELQHQADKFHSLKLRRAASHLLGQAQTEAQEYETLFIADARPFLPVDADVGLLTFQNVMRVLG
jgi:hypothetical protein